MIAITAATSNIDWNGNMKRKWAPGEMEGAHRIESVFVRKPRLDFVTAVQEYRQIEAELVQQFGNDERMTLELRRRIAEWIVRYAWHDDVPFEQFQAAWNDLLALGFTDAEKKREMIFYFADYCLNNEHYDLGLAEFDPVIAEFEQWLQTAVLKPKFRAFCEKDLENLKFLREGLMALRTGGDVADDWLARDDARGPTPEQQHHEELRSKLFQARKKIENETAQAGYAEIEQRYRQLEKEFTESLPAEDAFFLPEVKERITRTLFDGACELHQPFEVCRDLWNALAPWDFGHLETKCQMWRRYAECCLFHGQAAAGLAVVEPLLADLQHQVATGTDEDMAEDNYPEEIGKLEKLRDELRALPTSAAPPA